MWVDGGLRGFVARLVGWGREEEIDRAVGSVDLAMARRAHLVLCGEGDLVPIAYALHRRMLGAGRPFVVSDPRRRNMAASARSPANHESAARAIAAAAGGTLCVRFSRLPQDFASVTAKIGPGGDVQYVVCAREEDVPHPLLVMPAPIRLRSLRERAEEVPRLIDEYARDAVAELGAREACFTDSDRTWILAHAARSLSEIETATMRIVALRATANMSNAAARLRMAPVSLSRWVNRRSWLREPSAP